MTNTAYPPKVRAQAMAVAELLGTKAAARQAGVPLRQLLAWQSDEGGTRPNTVQLRIRSAIPKGLDGPVAADTDSLSARDPAGFWPSTWCLIWGRPPPAERNAELH